MNNFLDLVGRSYRWME